MPMRILSVVASPAVHLLSTSTDVVLRILGIRPVAEPPVTEEEIKILIEQGTKAGAFEEAERYMVERVFRLADRRVSELMTPRTEIVWLDIEDSSLEMRRRIADSGHSRFPVCQGSLDNILGVMKVKDLLGCDLAGEPADLKVSLRRPLFVPESRHALKVLELFKQSGTHISLVVDEYGSIQGLITLNDILEEVVGDIPTVEELAGMQIGRIPSVGNHFEWGGLRFEMMDMDGNRVDKVLVMSVRRAQQRNKIRTLKKSLYGRVFFYPKTLIDIDNRTKLKLRSVISRVRYAGHGNLFRYRRDVIFSDGFDPAR